MANEIHYRQDVTGVTLYATIRSEVRTYWNGSSLEALVVANWGTYDIALTETPASSYFYVGDWPAGLTTPGLYYIDIFQQLGASPAIGDELLWLWAAYWSGSALNLVYLTPANVNAEILDVLGTDTLVDGKTFVAALRYIAAICAGKISGARTGTEEFLGLDGATPRVTVTADSIGNRSAVVYD